MTSKEFLRPATTMNPHRNFTKNPILSNTESWKKTPYYNSKYENDYFQENRPYSSGIRLNKRF